MNITNDEKICSFYASDYHFEMISLPYIQKALEERGKVIIFTENDLSGTINKLINRMNLDKKTQDSILKINWKNDDNTKLNEIEKINKENKQTLIFIKGSQKYIDFIEEKFSETEIKSKTEIIDCYDVNELRNDTSKIAKKYDKVLNTIGKILLN